MTRRPRARTHRHRAFVFSLLAGLIAVGLALLYYEVTEREFFGAVATPAPQPLESKAAVPADSVFLLDILDFWDRYAFGFWYSLLVMGLCVLVTWVHHVTTGDAGGGLAHIYRRLEEPLVRTGKIDLDDLLKYHAQYTWGAYAAAALAAMSIGLPLLITSGDQLPTPQRAVLGMATIVMTMAAAVLAIMDLMHRNSQTPLIPPESRFRLIDISVVGGGIGVLLMLASVLSLLSVLSLELAFFGGVFVVVIYTFVMCQRSVPIDEIVDFFEVDRLCVEEGAAPKTLSELARRRTIFRESLSYTEVRSQRRDTDRPPPPESVKPPDEP